MSSTLARKLADAAPVTFEPKKQASKTGGKPLRVVSEYQPAGDQPTAIHDLVGGLRVGERDQVLLGVTGSGKTFSIAKVIEAAQRPALVLAPNKTLAAQLYAEMKGFFPDNAVEYFVSYYDYYQPEAYVPRTDTYIEKDSQINEAIDRMRHSATQALLERNDVVIVASVSCIYGIGSVETYGRMVVKLEAGGRIDRDTLARALVELQYRRNDTAFQRGTFRLRGETVDVWPSHLEDRAWRVTLFGDEIESLREFDPLTGDVTATPEEFHIYANSHYVTPRPTLQQAIKDIKVELQHRIAEFTANGQAARSRAHPAALHLRHRNDGDYRLLQKHRELFALPVRTQPRRTAADPVRVSARECPADRGREPRHRSRRSAAWPAATRRARAPCLNSASACQVLPRQPPAAL